MKPLLILCIANFIVFNGINEESVSMLYEFILYLPASVCILFAIMLALKYKKNRTQNLLMWILILAIPAALGDALYLCPANSFRANFVLDLLSAMTTPIIPFLGYVLLRTITGGNAPNRLIAFVTIVMSIYSSMLLMSIVLAGANNLMELQGILVSQQETYNFFTGLGGLDTLPLGFRSEVYLFHIILSRPIYYGLILFGIGWLTIYDILECIRNKVPVGQFFRFVFKGETISSFYLMTVLIIGYAFLGVLRIVIGVDHFRTYPILAILYSILLAQDFYLFGTASKHFPTQVFTIKSLFQQYTFAERGTTKEEMDSDIVSSNPLPQKAASAGLPEDADKMLRSLKKLMEDDLLFLNPNLTIEDIASELGTNRVYISRVVNQLMHETFRDYVNRLRIRYAKQYMRQNPAHNQEAVATSCGYQDAASFNRKFHQLTGMTPREWAAHEAQQAAEHAQRMAAREAERAAAKKTTGGF